MLRVMYLINLAYLFHDKRINIMFVFITVPFTQSVFDILDTNPEDMAHLSEEEYVIREKIYTEKLDDQYMFEAQAWVTKYIKGEGIITWAQNSGSETIEFELQIL